MPIEYGTHGYVHLGMSESPLLEHVEQTIRAVVGISSALMLAGGILAFIMARMLTKPIPDLIRVSEAVGKGDLDQNITVHSSDEMGALGNSINRMIENLRISRTELLAAKDYTEKILNSMSDILLVVNLDAKILNADGAVTRILNYTEGELTGQSIGIIYMDGETSFRSGILDKIARGEEVRDHAFTGRNKNSQPLPMLLSAAPMEDKEGRITGIVGIIRDRSDVQNVLYELDQIYNGSPSPMRVVDERFNIVSANEAFCRWAGIDKSEIRGRKCYEIYRSDRCRTDQCNLVQILKGKNRLDIEDERETRDGRKSQVRVLVTPFRNFEGNISGIIEVFTDIAGQKNLISQLEHKTRELEQAYEMQRTYADIITVLNSRAELSGLLSETLTRIASHTDAQAGVLYLYNSDQARLLPEATYAVERRGIEKGFALGEGLPGQAAKERIILSVSEVPQDCFRISSGIADGLPGHVVCLPVLFGQELMGVLELACFGAFDDGIKSLLTIIGTQLGISIHEARMHLQTERLADDLHEKNELLAAQNEELISQSEELVAMNEELQSQTEELANQKKILEDTTRKAQEADRLKSEFLSNMSHELRTPLNAILGMSSLLISSRSIDQQQHSYLQIIERNGQNLLQLINDILDLSKIESGRLEVARTEIPLGIFLEGTVATIGTLAEEKGLNLNISVDAGLKSIISDPDKLRQILTNLLSNAIKFTDEGGSVSVIASLRDPNQVDIAVSDTGIGIPKQDQSAIFEAFRQVDGTTTRKYGGTGLGLSIVKKLAALLEGTISLQSEPGKGSTFTLTMPIRPQDADSFVPAYQCVEDRIRPTMKPQEGEKNRHQEILIIDDDPVVTRELGIILKGEKYALEFAENGKSGLEKLRAKTPDLILLDLKMPGMDGFAFINDILKDDRMKDIPLVLVTAMDLSAEQRYRIRSANVRDIISKGQTDAHAFLQRIKAALSKYAVEGSGESLSAKYPLQKKSAKILIAEDKPDNLFLLKETIRPVGYTVFTAADGQEAVEVAQREFPALILMDVQMPVMDGYEATQRIRSIPQLENIPIIALTARAMRGEEEKALKCGCSDYISKPISPAEVLKRIKEWLKK